jgi:hypothetical protein
MRSPSTVGHRSPVYCTSVGKAVIAFLPDDVLDKLIDGLAPKPFTPRTLVTRAALKADLARVRDQGFAVDDEEIEQGLRCVGAPIRNHTGLVVAAISVAGPAFRLTNQCLPATARAVMAAARDLSKEMGYFGKKEGDSKAQDKPPAGDVRTAVNGATEQYRKSRAVRNQERVPRRHVRDDGATSNEWQNRTAEREGTPGVRAGVV